MNTIVRMIEFMNTIVRMIAFMKTVVRMRKSLNTILLFGGKIKNFRKLKQKK